MSDIICGENFNTLKKGPHWLDLSPIKTVPPIAPPPEFRDFPLNLPFSSVECYSIDLANDIISDVLTSFKKRSDLLKEQSRSNSISKYYFHSIRPALWGPEFIPFSPCQGRPNSRSSLSSSRLSSSHNSLSVPATSRVDDSSFITQVKHLNINSPFPKKKTYK